MEGPLQRMLAQKSPLILDGAMGTELQRRGINTALPLWSAHALLARPDAVLQIHRDYIDAGADIITADTFRTTRRTFVRAKLPDRSGRLTSTAVQLAMEAREQSGKADILIAGSIAPLEDCYRPDLVPPDDQLQTEHAELALRLGDAGVDYIQLETMNTIREAYAACEAALDTGKEVVVSFILGVDGNLLSGESLESTVNAVAVLKPAAFSMNCVSPRYIQKPLERLRTLTDLPIAVYGNVGLPETERTGWEFTRDVREEEYARFAEAWLVAGASIIGGCCGTTPDYIKALKKNLPPRHQGTKG